MSELRCEVGEQSGSVVIRLGGQFTFADVGEFERQLACVIARHPPRLVLDLSELRIMSSAGIGALLKLHRKMLETNGSLRLAALQPAIADVMRAAHLDSIFTMSATVADALE